MSIPVIGTGAVSAAGNDVASGWNSLKQGKSSLSPLTLFDPMTDEMPLVGQCDIELPSECFSRTEALALIAGEEALQGIDCSGLKLGLTVSTTVGGLDHSEQFYKKLKVDPELISKSAQEFARHEPAALTGFLGKKFGAKGCFTLSTACSTAVHGIGMGAKLIENGTYDLVLAIGTDALSLLTFRGFDSLLLVDYNGTRPFDANRIGISLGEAAGAVLLASTEVAEKLNAPIKGYVAGWGASADAHHMTAPHPEGRGAKEAAEKAMKSAGVSPEQVDWICAHGTGTPDNDKAEIMAMKQLFPEMPPFSSMKGALGHTLAASGAVETVYAIEAMKDGIVPTSFRFETQDPEIGTSPTRGETKELSVIVKNSFGFGGNNGSLILTKEPIQ